jgi:hypothetical protein
VLKLQRKIWNYEEIIRQGDQLVAGLQEQVAGLEHQRSKDHTNILQQAEQISSLQKQLDRRGADNRHLLHSESSSRHGKRHREGNSAELEQLRGEPTSSQE